MLPASQGRERVSYLEGKMEEMSKSLTRIEALLLAIDQKADRRFDRLFGLLVTTLFAMVAGVFTILAKLLSTGH